VIDCAADPWRLILPCDPLFSEVQSHFHASSRDALARDKAGRMLLSHAQGRAKARSLINHVKITHASDPDGTRDFRNRLLELGKHQKAL